MPTDRQRRQAAIRKAQRQLARRQQDAAKRRRRNQILGVAGTIIVVAGIIIGIVVGTGGSDKKTTATPTGSGTATAKLSAKPSSKPKKSTSPKPTASPYPTHTFAKRTHKPLVSSGPCKYAETTELLASPSAKDVGLPPDPSPTPSTGTAKLELATSQGPIEITLDRADAPCAVQSTIFLAQKGFYNDTACPRVVTSGIFVLQCGDPSNSQGGGPTYGYSEEINQHTTYGAGAVAMANTGRASTTGSQFFMVYQNSNQNPKTGSGLGRNFSLIGTITKGLDVVQKIARAGAAANPSPTATATSTAAPTDGKPIAGLTIDTVTVTA
ncbi:MAG: peptidylprolyl isomerase [Mycobacteriales bacterium]